MTQSSSPSKFPEEMRRHSNTVRIAIVYFVSTLAAVAFLMFLAVQTGTWQLYTITGVLVVLSIVYFIALRITRQGRIETGIGLMLTGTLAVLLIGVFLFKGMGLISGLSAVVVTFVLVYQGLPPKLFRWAMASAITVGVLTTAADLLPLDYRLNVPELRIFTPIIILLVVFMISALIMLSAQRKIANFWQASIRNRLTLIVANAAIVPIVVVSFVLGGATYIQVRDTLTQAAFERLAAVQTIKARQIESYLAERRGDMAALSDTMGSMYREARAKLDAVSALKRDQIVHLFQTWNADVRDVASDPGVVAGMRNLAAGFQELGNDTVRSLYLEQPHLELAQDGSYYSAAHAEQHGFFNGYIGIHGYMDALLIDPAGNIVYSTQKTDAFGTNLVNGTYKDSNLAKLYKTLVTTQAGKTYIADVANFEGKYAMFIGTPIYDGSTFVGILAYQLPLDVINNLMTERTGQGTTGETFLVAMEDDERITYRSDRPIAGNGELVIGYDLTSVAGQSIINALNGKTGGGLIVGSTGEAVINSYRPVEVEGLKWAVVARVTGAEALSPIPLASDKDFLTRYKESYGYYDILLIEPKGFVFYSVSHEADFGTNILTGEYKDSNLGALVAETLESKSYEFADFAYYAPSGGRPAAFHAIPVLNENNDVQFIVATQVSHEDISEIMSASAGLGETGETFILGTDQMRRTETRFLADLGVESTILNPQFKVNTVASRSALAGESGQAVFNDYRGIPVMGVWSPITVTEEESSNPESMLWGVIAKIDTSEALAPVNQLARAIGLVIGLAVLLVGGLAVFIGTRFAIGFVKPILTLTETAAQVAAGNMNLAVKAETADEIGTLSKAFNTMTSQMRDLIGSLEARVAARTKDLATVAEVGTATATILETNKLLQAVVDLTKERFELYHSHIYLLDETGDNLILAAGAGEPGRIMAAEKKSIPLSREQSLVARAARERIGVTINDVTEAPDFLPNPLLPNTRSELAVPMMVGGNVIGVFDVQSEEVGRFTDSDINIQTTLAAQVAASIQNVRSFEQAKTQADLETLVNSIGQKIQRSTTVEDTLQIAVREVGLALGASRVRAKIATRRSENDSEILN